jgi:hypothetical protein
MIHLVKEILSVEPYKLTLKFNTGEVRLVDLFEKLNEWSCRDSNSKLAELKNPEVFRKVKLDTDFDTLVWENGIDLCPDVLYELSTETNQKSVA